MMRKCGKKKLTRLVLAALLSTGGMLSVPLAKAAPIDTIDANYEGDGTKNVNGNNNGTDITTSTGSPSDNTITMNSGTFASITGGYDGGAVGASGNVVNINGGTITGNVVGGKSENGNSIGNTVNIYRVTDIQGGVYGGQAYLGTFSGNVINILGTINISGYLDGDCTEILNVASKDNSVATIYGGFHNINFFLPKDTAAGDTMLTVIGSADVKGATFGVAAQDGLTSLVKDDKVTLLKAGTLEADDNLKTTTKLQVPTGITTSDNYEFEITKSGTDSIIATVTKAEASSDFEVAKSLVETRAATTTFVNAGADMLASQGFAQAANAVALEAAESKQDGAVADRKQTGVSAPSAGAFTPFAAFGGSSLRAESGSYVDTKGFGLNIGFAREVSNSQGKLLFGPLVEYGGGNYDSYLDDGTHGEGGSHYWGIGIMARQVNHDGFYYEGSVRGGRVTSDYKSHLNNQDVSYDSASNYWAAHLGLGKVFEVGGNNTVDGYFKYFYSHQGGDDVTIHGSVSGDEQWNFDGVNSNRIRIGARLTHKVNEMNSFYGGLAYQYEFGGEARAHYNGGTTPSPSVKGSSGMLELGWQVKPGGPLTLDLGVTGWAGKQRGGSVQLGATWTF
ncbi:MAG: autotransporter outer membrane beta-barrel domain-containing protein [Schwartzia succinivorans]|nr:autotransporter outer membrane beta-barrel domain-containing protein [Schwartzia succinivorans]